MKKSTRNTTDDKNSSKVEKNVDVINFFGFCRDPKNAKKIKEKSERFEKYHAEILAQAQAQDTQEKDTALNDIPYFKL